MTEFSVGIEGRVITVPVVSCDVEKEIGLALRFVLGLMDTTRISAFLAGV